jgi:hypothetical protein
MGTRFGLVLLALGAILTFAIDDRISGVDLSAVGVILMVVGAVATLVDLLALAPRRRSSRSVISETAAPAGVGSDARSVALGAAGRQTVVETEHRA